MKINTINRNGAAALAVLATVTIPLAAQPRTTEFVPFQSFLEHTRNTNISEMTAPETRVREAAAFEQMRAHVLKLYDSVEVTHSFVQDASHFDCVPMMQQPAARNLGLKTAPTPPPDSLLPNSGNATRNGIGEGATRRAVRPANAVDQFGNSMTCEAGTIPMRRVTLEEMSRFANLRDYFKKGPGHVGQAPAAPGAAPADPTAGHNYATLYQSVANTGAGTTINIWNPYIDLSSKNMSLSQEWVSGGGGNAMQTAEVGWQVQPYKFGTQDTVLFIYWTADDYQTTGCYNLECGVFFQAASDVPIGASLADSYSTVGGAQNDFSVWYLLYQGDWWLNINNEWIGCYPGSLYNGGAMSQQADTIRFGTESYGPDSPWPAQGGGNFAESGYGQAAYQRNMYYIDPSGNAYWAQSLTIYETALSCYDASQVYTSDDPNWAAFFYSGGPGGSVCQ